MSLLTTRVLALERVQDSQQSLAVRLRAATKKMERSGPPVRTVEELQATLRRVSPKSGIARIVRNVLRIKYGVGACS